ncbi:site-specific integrase [Furfurilactobacillus entadae]|uniref:site-specific integrase n=1 Tax=Furfurilactobacillus entadae TaxID=2922307 RepID=UPI0035EEBA8A
MASFIKRGTGWQVKIAYQDNGSKKWLTKQGFKTKSEARAFAVEQEAKMLKSINLGQSTQRFVDYYMNWYKTFKEPIIAPATKRRYRSTINTLMAYFPVQNIGDITRTDYQEMLNSFAYGSNGGQPHAKSSVQKLNVQIRECVRDAIQDSVIDKDFTYNATLGGSKGRDERSKYLDEDEMIKLLNAVQKSPSAQHVVRAMITTALYTGLRIGEVAGLTWDDINFNFKTVDINKSWDFQVYGFKPTKNEASKRIIRVNDELLSFLHDFKISQSLYEFSNPRNSVFITTRGWVPDSTATTKELNQLCKQLDINRITFHGLRHTHASYLLSTGSTIEYVSQRLGHASIQTTLSTYSHLLKNHKRAEDGQALASLSQAVGNKQKIQKLES